MEHFPLVLLYPHLLSSKDTMPPSPLQLRLSCHSLELWNGGQQLSPWSCPLSA